MNKKILYCDLDGVLADFEGTLYNMFPELLQLEDSHEIRGKMIDHLCATVGTRIFRNLEPLKNAIAAFEILSEEYATYFLSTPMWGVPDSYTDKRLWIEDHFGELSYKKLILSHNKGLLRGHYLIDDRIKNGVEDFKGVHIHFAKNNTKDWLETLEYLSDKDQWDLTKYHSKLILN